MSARSARLRDAWLRMLPLIPYHRIVIRTRLKPAEARTLIRKHIGEPLQRPRGTALVPASFAPPYPWEGQISGDAFRIRRCVAGRAGFLPHAFGAIRQTSEGSDVVVRLTLHPGIWLGLGALVIATVLMLALYVVNAGPRNTLVGPLRLVPIGLFGLGYALVMIRFAPEARTAERFFRAMFAKAEADRPDQA